MNTTELVLTQGQIQHDLLLGCCFSTQQGVHSAEEPRDEVAGELHQPHHGTYAAPWRLFTGTHSEAFGQPQIYRQQKPEGCGEYRLTQTDREVTLCAGGEVRTTGAPAAHIALWGCSVPTQSADTIPPGRQRGHFHLTKCPWLSMRPSLWTTQDHQTRESRCL